MVDAVWRGRVAYRDMLAEQHAIRERVWAGGEGAVILCEHEPVITLGRSANRANVLVPDGVAVETIERGGDVTYHGPGQLMIYPVVRIKSVVAFLERVAAAIVATCDRLGVRGAEWRRDPAGVWIDDAKIAACGIHVGRGVSVHGFAFNIDTPDDMWRRIRPCGLSVEQRSLSVAARERIDVERVAHMIAPMLSM